MEASEGTKVSYKDSTMGTAFPGKANNQASRNGNGSYRRRAHHAGSWYEDDADELHETLSGFLNAVETTDDTPTTAPTTMDTTTLPTPTPSPPSRIRALIVPHAGYSYSGPTAAYAYAALQSELRDNKDSSTPIRTILVLHPSHHMYLKGCAVSGASVLETPLGPLTVNDNLRQEILGLASGKNVFSVMDKRVDEAEHSGEMQYPYLARVLQSTRSATSTTTATEHVTVLPVMCGSLSVEQEQVFGTLLADIIARPEVVTVVSTDFCHWGSRFSYQPTPDSNGNSNGNSGGSQKESLKLHEFIERMDRRGMTLIELQQPGAFATYLQETKNTVCGRHAVAVWLRAVEAKTKVMNDSHSNSDQDACNLKVDFVRYAQSSPVLSMSDSSVSYAAAVAKTTTAL